MARRRNPYVNEYTQDLSGINRVYQPTYDPSVVDRYAGILQQSQQKYDQARGNLSDFTGVVGAMDTTDPDFLNEQLSSFTDRATQLVDEQYGGDYGAAAGDLAAMIAQEKGNVAYKAINFQNQQAKAMREFKNKKRKLGERGIVTNDPTTRGKLREAIDSGDYMSKLAFDGIEAPNYDELAFDIASRVPASITESLVEGLDERDKDRLRHLASVDPKGFFESVKTKTNIGNLRSAKQNMINSMINQAGPQLVAEARLNYPNASDEELRMLVNKQADSYLSNVVGQIDFIETDRTLNDKSGNVTDSGDDFSKFDTQNVLPVNSERKEVVKKEGEFFTNKFLEEEPVVPSATSYSRNPTVQEKEEGRAKEADRLSMQRKHNKWKSDQKKLQETFDNEIVPFAVSSIGYTKDELSKMSKEEKAELGEVYYKTLEEHSALQDSYTNIPDDIRPRMKTFITDRKMGSVDNFNINGTDVSPEKIFDELDVSSQERKEFFDNTRVEGISNTGEMIAVYSKPTKKGIERKYMKFYPNKNFKNLYKPVKDVIDNFDPKKAKPGITSRGNEHFIYDYVLDRDRNQLVPRIYKLKEGDQFDKNNISDFMDEVISGENKFDVMTLDRFVKETHNASNKLYNTLK